MVAATISGLVASVGAVISSGGVSGLTFFGIAKGYGALALTFASTTALSFAAKALMPTPDAPKGADPSTTVTDAGQTRHGN